MKREQKIKAMIGGTYHVARVQQRPTDAKYPKEVHQNGSLVIGKIECDWCGRWYPVKEKFCPCGAINLDLVTTRLGIKTMRED